MVRVHLLELLFTSVFELTKCSLLNIGLLGDDRAPPSTATPSATQKGVAEPYVERVIQSV